MTGLLITEGVKAGVVAFLCVLVIRREQRIIDLEATLRARSTSRRAAAADGTFDSDHHSQDGTTA